MSRGRPLTIYKKSDLEETEEDRIEQWFREALQPDPILTVSEWADKHRILSQKSSSEYGPWRTSRTPYLREIMDTLGITHPAKKVVFKKASQVGGTEAGNNWIGYIIDHSPGPAMLVMPTVDNAKRNSRLRIDPLIEESPRLRGKVRAVKSRDNANTVQQKDFDNGTLIMTGANSAAGLKSTPCKYVLCDELDEYADNVEGQGSPVALVLARSRTFSRRKAYLVSTATLEGASKIDAEFEESDQRFYNVPCPHCNAPQVFDFENLSWPGKNEDGPQEPNQALYYCVGCGEGIEERHKTKMLEAGVWIPTYPERETVGFFINSLYSPLGWFSWGDIAKDYIEAQKDMKEKKDSAKMRTFTNTILGLSFKETGEAPEWKKLYLRRTARPMGIVPNGVVFLTCAVDVQQDRLEVEVRGWGKNKRSWSVDLKVIPGKPEEAAVWDSLTEYLGETFATESGGEMPIRITGVDSGYLSQTVYNYVRKFAPDRVIALKGDENLNVMIAQPKIVDAKLKGKVSKRRGAKLWKVGVTHIKDELYSWLRLDEPVGDEPYPQGWVDFPEYDDEYFKQLTAEVSVTKKNRKGNSFKEYVKIRERNEALDLAVYNRALASLVGLDRMRDDQVKKAATQSVAKPAEIPHTTENAPREPGDTRPNRPRRSPRPRRASEIW